MSVMLPLILTALVDTLVIIEQVLLHTNKISVFSRSHTILTSIISFMVVLGLVLWYVYIRLELK